MLTGDEGTIQGAVPQEDAAASLTAILACVAQPVWVVDHEGMIVFGNQAAVTALGYDELGELLGRHSHDTIHHKHRDGSPYPAEECELLRYVLEGAGVNSGEDWFVRRDGSMFPVEYTATPIETANGTGAVLAFTDIEQRRRRRAGAARARGDPRARRAAGLGRRPGPAASTTPTPRRSRRSATPICPSSRASPGTRRSTTSTRTERRIPRRTAR